MREFLAVAVLLAVGLFACATPYGREGAMGGYSEFPLGDDTYEITASGNAYTSESRVRAMVQYRAAEFALERGFDHFVVLDGSQQTDRSLMVLPGHSSAQGDAYGWSASSTGPQAYSVAKHKARIAVRLVHGAVPGAVDAREAMDMLGPTLGIAGAPPGQSKTRPSQAAGNSIPDAVAP